MDTQCVSLLFFLGLLNAIAKASSLRRSSITCPIPDIDHGRVVVRGFRAKMIKFVCDKRYELSGNKYATCRGNNWDVPIPVCIRPGCFLPAIENGLQIPTSNGAHVTHFCFSGYTMVGSASIYCNGRDWNAPVPTCVDSTQKIASSCDFEDPGLCGWTQDEMHDFDWTRLNNKTPSSFLLTGPSYDHTYGTNGSGYYMYIESTSRQRNDTARFISPIYNKGLSENGCFSFFYHMFGATCGGLRVYQKPDNIPLQTILNSPGSKNKYILFEKWGNHGDVWLNSVSRLMNLGDNFQIVIEGIRGSSFTSDIAIDDVAILQGENCTAAMDKATTTSIIYMPDSCAGRCMTTSAPVGSCGCRSTCLAYNDCCPDFLELCVFLPDSTSSDDGNAVSNETPHTEKHIGTSPHTTSISALTTTTTTSTTTTTTTTTPRPTITPIPGPTTSLRPTTTRRPTTTPRPTITPIPTTTKRPTTTTRPSTTTRPTITTRITTTLRYNKPSRPPRHRKTEGTVTVEITQPKLKSTTKMAAISSTKRSITPWTPKTLTNTNTSSTKRPPSTNKVTTEMSHGISRTIENHNQYHEMVEKAKKEKAIEVRKLHHENNDQNKSSGWKIVFIILGTVICLASISWLVVVSRSSRGRIILARLRGRCNQDPEVRYLSTDVDD